MKRIISITLIFVLILLMSVYALAADSQTLVISANSATVQPGETAAITLTVQENPGFVWLIMRPKCDPNIFSWNAQKGDLPLDMDQEINVVWSADEDCTGLGALATLTFTVAENAQPGQYTISFAVYECFNMALEDVAVSMATITITVGNHNACSHASTADVPEMAPGCETDGYTAGVICKDCGTILSGHQKIAATGHCYDMAVIAPTCEANGYTQYSCANCDSSYSENVVAALGHLDENRDHICDNGCGTVMENCSDADGDGDHVCDICGKADVTAHHYGQATCNSIATCTECGISTGTELAHTEVVDAAVAPTCNAPGRTEGKHCAVCGEVLIALQEIPATGAHTNARGSWEMDGDHHWHLCDVCGAVFAQEAHEGGVATCAGKAQCIVCDNAYGEIDPQKHHFGQWTLKTAPTAETEGEEIRSCAQCGVEESRPLEKLPAVQQGNNGLILVAVLVVLVGAGIAAFFLLKKKRGA